MIKLDLLAPIKHFFHEKAATRGQRLFERSGKPQ